MNTLTPLEQRMMRFVEESQNLQDEQVRQRLGRERLEILRAARMTVISPKVRAQFDERGSQVWSLTKDSQMFRG